MNSLLITVCVFGAALLMFGLAVGVGKWLKYRSRKRWWV